MQSYLQSQAPLAPFATLRLTELTTLCGPVTRARLIRTGRAYALIFAVAAILLALVDAPALDALALGLMAPGAGFLLWAGPGCAMPGLYLAFSLLSLLAFAGALALWFSTGNVVAPVAVWGLAALAAAAVGASGFNSNAAVFTGVRTGVPLGIVVALVAALLATRLASLSAGRERARLNTYLASIDARHPAEAPANITASVVPASVPTSHHDELSLSDLQLMRLLLDRALQPVDRFDGFECSSKRRRCATS